MKAKPDYYNKIDFNKVHAFCVMCYEPAIVYAPETDEALCSKCMLNNNEARSKQ